MTITINGSGTIAGISQGGLNDNIITQAEIATTGVAGNGPAFSAYMGSPQTLTGGVTTKLVFNAETFDTNNNFDSTTNYRFTPTVAGYYQISMGFVGSAPSGGDQAIYVYKNGAKQAAGGFPNASAGYTPAPTVSCLVYCNGSTDYIESYAYSSGQNALQTGFSTTFFTGFLARAA